MCRFELRVIIYNTVEVPLIETNILGEPSVDIYVKSWIRGIDQPLQTDVHYKYAIYSYSTVEL